MMMRDAFNSKWPQDLKILDSISHRLAVIRGSVQSSKPGGHKFLYRYGLGFVDARGFPADDGGLALTADELMVLSQHLNALIASGEIKHGCDKAEHDAGVEDRETFLRQFDAKHKPHFR